MKKISLFLSTILLIAGCHKGDMPVNQNPNPNSPFVLDSMIFDQDPSSEKMFFTYRADKMQDKVIETFYNVTDTVSFLYNNNQLSRLTSSRFPKRLADYIYDANGKIITTVLTGRESFGVLKYDYSYDAIGRVKLLTFSRVNTGAVELLFNFSYLYDFAGQLRKITAINPAGDSTITYEIQAYTDECFFNPWAFITPLDVVDEFQIYNLPVLQGMKRLPAKIVKTFIGGGLTQVIKASISNKKLNSLQTNSENTGDVKSSFQSNINFFYH